MNKYTYAKGRRKTATATVRLFEGDGEYIINGKESTEIYSHPTHKTRLEEPLVVAGLKGKYHFTAKTTGGGFNGQLDAIVLGLARALEKEDDSLRSTLKSAGLLSRDDRMVERKKTGLRKARKAPQFSKR